MSYPILTPIVGGAVGWVASILMKANAPKGLFANGIAGSYLGIVFACGLSSAGEHRSGALHVAVICASALIWVARAGPGSLMQLEEEAHRWQRTRVSSW